MNRRLQSSQGHIAVLEQHDAAVDVPTLPMTPLRRASMDVRCSLCDAPLSRVHGSTSVACPCYWGLRLSSIQGRLGAMHDALEARMQHIQDSMVPALLLKQPSP